MVLVATGGNLIVIWIVMANRRMRTVTNIFLVNLSVADTMVSTLNVVFNFTYMLNLHWQFGLVYCKISQFVSILSICASVFTLMAISFDSFMQANEELAELLLMEIMYRHTHKNRILETITTPHDTARISVGPLLMARVISRLLSVLCCNSICT
ncbi:tachykinin-like peptides receptor 99D [Penaeus indicus]|uniref:tachykinin-like peptides receptor 99D n=1 Tax=Penaeus indicus TaxID=29960 RepID=UPI00300C013E